MAKSIVFENEFPAEKLAETQYKPIKVIIWSLVGMLAVIWFLLAIANYPTDRDFIFVMCFAGAVTLLDCIIISVLLFIIRLDRSMKLSIKEKQVSWNAESRRFRYKDEKDTLYFSPDDVTKWIILPDEKTGIDIFRLRTGEQVILETAYNKNIHPFLCENAQNLGLPEPKIRKWLFFVNIYKIKV